MSLFETLSEMNKQHANAGDAGQYNYTDPILASSTNGDCHNMIVNSLEEPAPTVSLYNLLDHSARDLEYLLQCIRREEQHLEPHKLLVANTYTAICAWAAIIETAHTERVKRDSEAWAEKTAKEINET